MKRAKRIPKVKIELDQDAGMYVASWDDPQGGGFTTQAKSLNQLYPAIEEAIRCHFGEKRPVPRQVTLHFEVDPVLQFA